MIIGLVCPYNIGLGGGVQECVMAAQKELKKRGHKVYIITPRSKEVRDNPPKDTILVGSGTDVRSPFSTTAQISASMSTDELNDIITRYNFDILHFHEPWVPVLSRQLLAKSKSINVATFHARMPDGIMTKTIEMVVTPYTKSILKSFDALTAVSKPASQYASNLTNNSIQIISNGIDLKKYHNSRNVPRSKKTILHIGRLEKRKGVNYLIDAFAHLNDPESRLMIVGNGPDRQKLEDQVNNLGLKNVEFLGFVPEEKKIQLLQEASVFSSAATYGESFGIVLLEAMACGTPVVAANNPGYVSVLRGRGMLALVDPLDTEQYARRLALMLYDEELRKLWQKWAYKYVKRFDYEKIIDQYESLYQGLIDKHQNAV